MSYNGILINQLVLPLAFQKIIEIKEQSIVQYGGVFLSLCLFNGVYNEIENSYLFIYFAVLL